MHFSISIWICLTIYVEPSPTRGQLLVWSLESDTIVPSILACPFTAISYSICIPFMPCRIPAYAMFWCPDLNGFHFPQMCAIQGSISSIKVRAWIFELLFLKKNIEKKIFTQKWRLFSYKSKIKKSDSWLTRYRSFSSVFLKKIEICWDMATKTLHTLENLSFWSCVAFEGGNSCRLGRWLLYLAFSTGNDLPFKYMCRFKGTTGTGV